MCSRIEVTRRIRPWSGEPRVHCFPATAEASSDPRGGDDPRPITAERGEVVARSSGPCAIREATQPCNRDEGGCPRKDPSTCLWIVLTPCKKSAHTATELVPTRHSNDAERLPIDAFLLLMNAYSTPHADCMSMTARIKRISSHLGTHGRQQVARQACRRDWCPKSWLHNHHVNEVGNASVTASSSSSSWRKPWTERWPGRHRVVIECLVNAMSAKWSWNKCFRPKSTTHLGVPNDVTSRKLTCGDASTHDTRDSPLTLSIPAQPLRFVGERLRDPQLGAS